MKVNLKKPELLIPAGDFEKALFGLEYGADALYVGGKQFSLRARSSNFDLEHLEKLSKICKEKEKKLYVAVNIIFHNQDLNELEFYLRKLEQFEVTGIIVADPYAIDLVNKLKLKLEIHISTQQSITNSKAIQFWKENNASRVVLAREVSKEELIAIKKKSPLEIEYFVHGAICIAYSGRCVMSNHFSFRDANKGGCAHSCRWNYQIDDNSNNLFTMSAKDLNLINNVNDLIEIGVDSFKIEGRMKTKNYVASTTKAYREAIDNYFEKQNQNDNVKVDLKDIENRETDQNFFHGLPSYTSQFFQQDQNEIKKVKQNYLFEVLETKENYLKIRVKNYFKIDDQIELVIPYNNNQKITIDRMINSKQEDILIANKPNEIIVIFIKHGFNNKINQFAIGKLW